MRGTLLTVLGIGTIGALLATSTLAGRYADQRQGTSDSMTARELLYLPSPAQARLMSLGFQQLVADWYWVRALQYFIEPANEINQYRNLADFMDVVVGIDPDFEYAYKFAGVGIPFDVGRMRYANTERAIGFLERGVQRFPHNWELRLYLGFYLLNFRQDTAGAAEQFAQAAPLPKAPPYLTRFAARLFSASGELDRARTFTEQMLAVTEDPDEQARLRKRLEDIALEARFREVEGLARRFKEDRGRWPYALAELATTHVLPPLPPDAVLEDGTVTATTTKRLVVYEHPREDPVRAAK